MKTKNKILSAVLATSLAIGALQMTPIKTFAATGDVVLPFLYDSIGSFMSGDIVKVFFSTGYANIRKDGENLLLLKTGTVIDLDLSEYDEVSFHSGFLYFAKRVPDYDNDGYYNHGMKYGIMNSNGEWVLSVDFDYISEFKDGVAMVAAGKECACINSSGEVVAPLKYNSDRWEGQEAFTNELSEGLASVATKDEMGGYIDTNGDEVIPLKYDGTHDFNEGLAAVSLNNKWGFIDKSGKTVVPFKYSYATMFKEGRAAVKKNGKWGFVNKKGKVVVPIKYSSVEEFSDGFAKVKLKDKYGYINKSGKEIVSPKYDYVRGYLNNKLFFTTKDKKIVL